MSSDTVQRVKDALPIEEVVGSYVKLERAGRNMRARCPFHNERTPSFYVTPERGMFKCFGCGKGGDIFSFVQEIEGLDFYGTLKLLAQKAGVQLTHEQSTGHKHSPLYDILELAQKWYEVQLRQTPEVVDYLLGRGLTKETLVKFHVGYAPAGQDTLYRILRQRGYTDQDIEASGLCSRNERKNFYDRFHERIMFPINDTQGRVVAFSGRIFPLTGSTTDISKTGKYVNSPEGALYNKSKILFGYDKAKRSILTSTRAVIVEGQIDLLLAHQVGTTEAVALSGTALTPDHCKLIRRFTDTIILALDGDEAGIHAAGRSVGVAYSEDMDVRVILVPDGKDPADIIKNNPKDWQDLLSAPRDYVDVRLEGIAHDKKLTSATDKFKAIRTDIFPFIHMLPNAMYRDTYIQKIGSLLGNDVAAVRQEYERFVKNNSVKSNSSYSASSPPTAKNLQTSLSAREMALGLIDILKSVKDVTSHIDRFTHVAGVSYQVAVEDMGSLLDEMVVRIQMHNLSEEKMEETLVGALDLIELETLQTQRQDMRMRMHNVEGKEKDRVATDIEKLARRIDEMKGKINSD